MRRPLLISSQFDVLELVSSISHKGSVITMAKHKSVEAERLTELGRGLHAWANVLFNTVVFNGGSVYDSNEKTAMRELALMEDTAENRELLQKAAYRCGLSDSEAEALASWVENDDPLWNMLPGDHSMFGMQHDMRAELAEYVRGTWPDIQELADMVCDADDVADRLFAETRPASDVMLFRRGGDLLAVGLDTDAAEDIAMSCPDLDNPPIGIAMAVNDGAVEHMVCTTVDQAVEAVVDRIHRFDTEGK